MPGQQDRHRHILSEQPLHKIYLSEEEEEERSLIKDLKRYRAAIAQAEFVGGRRRRRRRRREVKSRILRGTEQPLHNIYLSEQYLFFQSYI